jgi:modulator of FtsH protease
MGYSLGPVLAKSLALPGGAQVVTLALAATGATFLGLSAWVLTSRRDFSFMGGFLFAGMVIALLAGLGAVFLQVPALGLAVAAMVALLSAGLILFETSRIVTGARPTTSSPPWGCTSRSSTFHKPVELVRVWQLG